MVRLAVVVLLTVSMVDLSPAATVEVKLNESLAVVLVTVAPGSGPLRLHNQDAWDSLEILENGRRQGERLLPLDSDEAIVYRVALTHRSPQWAISRWHAPLRLADWHDWLLTPVAWSMTRPLTIRIQLPEGADVSMPFERSKEDGQGVLYRAYPVMADHGGLTMFGNVQVRQLKAGNSRIELAVVGEQGEESARLFKWAEDVVYTALDVHGAGPGPATIMMIPVPLVSGAVPWAHVRRGGGSHIIAYVREGLDQESLYRDWTLFHEVTHLYHPYLHSGGRWVSEGLASYYQNIYRATAGVVSPDYAYSRLRAGLERGRKENESAGNRPVTQGGRMRTYWTGAALAFQADAFFFEGQLVTQPRDHSDLARAIGQFAEEQMPVQRSWHPRDYLKALDAYLDEPLLVDLYDDYVRDRFFPAPDVAPDTWEMIFRGGQVDSR